MKLSPIQCFSFGEFLLVLISCIILSLYPKLGLWPLILAAFPWLVRIFWKDVPFQKTPFDLLIILFLMSALIGLWAAYNQEGAFQKLFLLIGAALLFFALANQPSENLWLVIISLGIFGVLTNIFFFMTTDWTIFNADFGAINQFGRWWSAARPDSKIISELDISIFHPNIVGGINAVLVPPCTAFVVYFWRNKSRFLGVFSSGILLLISLGMALTSSRAAWVATLIGLGLFWALNQSRIRRILIHKHVLAVLPILIVISGTILPLFIAKTVAESNNPITNITSFSSRTTLARDTLYLITDFPFTGGGLGSFPGLYSEYMLVIPHFIFSYSHNLYLDMALEQGIAGFFLWISIIIICAVILETTIKTQSTNKPKQLLTTALYASLIVLLIHGIMDDPFYSSAWGLPLLFLIPGTSVAVSDHHHAFSIDKKYYGYGAVILCVFLGVFALYHKQISASWNANLGAVDLSKQVLQDWPTGEWSTNSYLALSDSKLEEHFRKAISSHSANRTTNHRMGLILMSQQTYPRACEYLRNAYLAAPEHRGIRKSLGYCYTWMGDFEQAIPILTQIPEAKAEMEAYIGWWQVQGKDDLAANASQMAQLLGTE